MFCYVLRDKGSRRATSNDGSRQQSRDIRNYDARQPQGKGFFIQRFIIPESNQKKLFVDNNV